MGKSLKNEIQFRTYFCGFDAPPSTRWPYYRARDLSCVPCRGQAPPWCRRRALLGRRHGGNFIPSETPEEISRQCSESKSSTRKPSRRPLCSNSFVTVELLP